MWKEEKREKDKKGKKEVERVVKKGNIKKEMECRNKKGK